MPSRLRAHKRTVKHYPQQKKPARSGPGRRWIRLCDGGMLAFLLSTLFLFFDPVPAGALGLRLMGIGCASAVFLGVCAWRGGLFDSRRFFYWLFPILLVGLGYRLLIASYAPGHGSDLGLNERWMRSATVRGVTQSYTNPLEGGKPNYPPFSLMIFAVTGHFIQWLFPAGFGVGQYTNRIFLRLPSMGADLLTAITLALIVCRVFPRRYALIASAVYVFHPAVLFETAVWGQTDSIHTFFLVAAFAAIFWRYWILTGFFFALAVLTKAQAVILAPVFVLLCIRDWRAVVKLTVGGTLSVCAVVAPFAVQNSLSEVIDVYTGSVGHFSKLSMNAFNLWWVLFGKEAGKMSDTVLLLDTISYRNISITLFAVAVALMLWLYRRPLLRPDRPIVLLRTGTLIISWLTVCFFLFNTEMHERYLFPLVAFGLPLAFFERRTAVIYSAMSFLFFMNLAGAHHFNAIDRWVFNTFPNIGRTIAFLQLFLFAWLLQYAWNTAPRLRRSRTGERPAAFARFLLRMRTFVAICVRRCRAVLSSPITIFWLIITLGIFVRVYKFGAIPPGLNQDEASLAYDAFSLLKTGMDRSGLSYPIQLPAWGGGMSDTLSAYLMMPIIAVFGLNVFSARFLNLLGGIASLFLFYELAKRLASRSGALLGLFLLVISPWHIMASRWGLGAHLFPVLFLSGFYLFICALRRPWLLMPSFAIFGLSLYSYETSYFVVPVFLILATAVLLWRWPAIRGAVLPALGIVALFAIPIILFVIINEAQWPSLHLGSLTIPQFPATPRFHGDTSLSHNTLMYFRRNVLVLMNIVVFQKEKWLWNAIPNFGTFYLFNNLFLLFGVGAAIQRIRKGQRDWIFVFLWAIVALVLGLLFESNVNRINVLFFPLLLLVLLGIDLLRRTPVVFAFAIGANIIALLFFVHAYFVTFPDIIGPHFYESFHEAIAYAAQTRDGTICVTTSHVRQPEIAVLFTERMNPKEYRESVKFRDDRSAFRTSNSLSRYVFGLASCPKDTSAYVIHNSENAKFPFASYTIQIFKNFSVAIRKNSAHK
ncbi:MAG: glycosyltransferase family 39 protein [Candidatus Peribacteraceae bacterium]|nr:glycosyltransferase family 39 protein [Candidatus Peribacteraceae bacterium]MDD5739355.1 glycosyltransferase family 39 protein [Candidatus Peribacteraceae bacterium]